MPYVTIGRDAQIYRGIIGRKSLIEEGALIGSINHEGICVIEENIVIPSDAQILENHMISKQKQVG
jgi:glucose-1-phosphate adenylyltransferase